MKRLFFFIISLGVVAFGQPSFVPWLGVFAAACGYGLFWYSIAIYPLARQRFSFAFFWYSAVSLIQLSWMASIEFQGAYILLVLLGLTVWLGLQFGCLTLLIPYNGRLGWVRFLAIAAVWTLLEWSRFFYLFCGFSWNPVGMALAQFYSLEMAALFGVLGLSFWVILVNLLALRAFSKKRQRYYLTWASLAVVPYLFGMGYSFYHDSKEANRKTLSCALVQTGLLPSEKIPLQGKFKAFISPYEQWRRILTLLKDQPDLPLDLVVLPEGVVPNGCDQCNYSEKKVEQIFVDVFGPEVLKAFPKNHNPRVSNAYWTQTLANHLGADVILGLDHLSDGIAHNSAFRFRPGGEEEVSRYDKRILMPLAEYLPFEWLRPLVKNYGIEEFYTPGTEAKVFPGELPLSVSICYEETFPKPVREGRVQGAKLLVNLTNDAWYPFSRLPSQHYEHARLRAVENGVPMIRACNTGITAAVDSLGRETGRLRENGDDGKPFAGALYTTVDVYEHTTPYLFWGDAAILWSCFFFLCCFLISKCYPLVLIKILGGRK